MFTEQMSQGLSLADKIDPSNATAGTVTSTGLSAAKFNRMMYEIQIGAITGAGTLDANLQSSPNANFSPAHNISGSNITQITNANGTTGNCRVTLEVRSDIVNQQNPGDTYVRLRVVTAANSIVYGATGWGGEATQKPASAQDLSTATVVQRAVTP